MERGALGPNNSVHQRKNMKAGDPAKSERREMLICLSDLRKETECPICLGIIRKTRTVMECLHRFCRECIDKAMRIGNNECPACRVHCASRRSLRADPNFDSLIAALYPDVDKYEEEELAFRDEDTERNRRIQERIADTQRRQTEALVKRRSTIPASGGSFAGVRGGDGTFKSLRSRGRTRSKTLGVKRRSEASVDGEREGQLREIGRRTIRRPRIYEEAYLSDSLGGSGGFTEEEEEGDASFGEGGADEADPDFENNIGKRRGASAAAVVASAAAAAAAASAATAAAPAAMSGEGTGTGAAGMGGGASGGNAVMLRPPSTDVGTMLGNSANSGGGGASPGVNNPQPTTSGGNGHSGGLVTWARNGVRSHNRYGGNGNGGGNKLVKSFRAAGLLDALIARRDEEKAYEIHFCMCPLPSFVDTKEEPLAPLERMYLCCAPEIAVFHLRKFLKSRLVPTPQGELELVVQRLRQPFLDIGHGTPPAAYVRAIAGGPKGGGSLLLGRGFQRPMELEVLSDSRTLQTILSDSWDFRGTLVLFYRLKK